MALRVSHTSDAREYAGRVAGVLDGDPVRTSVVASTLESALADPAGFADAWWVWAERHGRVVAAAMHVPPRPLHLATGDPEVGAAVADYLAATGRPVRGAGGFRAAVEAFTARWRTEHSVPVRVLMDQGVYEARDVTPPAGVPGSLRRAGPGDADLLNGWARGFVADVGEAVPPAADELTEKVARGQMWVWEHAGVQVSMAWASAPAGGVTRVSWVYTPPEHRRHGYAGAVVAGVSAAQIAAGHRCMLYTDLANPTSNRVYQRVGYHRVDDAVTLGFADD